MCSHFDHLPVTHTEVWGLQAALMTISPRGHQARIAPDVVALDAGWAVIERAPLELAHNLCKIPKPGFSQRLQEPQSPGHRTSSRAFHRQSRDAAGGGGIVNIHRHQHQHPRSVAIL